MTSTTSISLDDHTYKSPREGDKRSPCPGLNALANHGYLPRNGDHITLPYLMHALRTVYNLSTPLALLLSLAGLLLCGTGIFPRHLSLAALAAHNRIEHDASLVHANAPRGSRLAPTAISHTLLRALLAHAHHPSAATGPPRPPARTGTGAAALDLRDFALVRASREATLRHPLSPAHLEIARAEAAMTWLLLRDPVSGAVSAERVAQFFGEERIPAGWTRPARAVGLRETRARVRELGRIIRVVEAEGRGTGGKPVRVFGGRAGSLV